MLSLILVALCSFVPLAQAEELSPLSVSTSVGLETNVNDSFVYRNGLRAGVQLEPLSWLVADVSGGFYPDMSQADWKPLVHTLVNEFMVSPHISKVIWQARAELLVMAPVAPERR